MFLSYEDAKKRFRCVTAQGGEGIIGRDQMPHGKPDRKMKSSGK